MPIVGSANAAGMSWTPSLLVVDIATLPNFLTQRPNRSHPHTLGSEWFQALIQYSRQVDSGMIARSWAEVLQQIRQQSVDLLLICLENQSCIRRTDSTGGLGQQHDVPPVLVLDQRLNQAEVRKEFCCKATAEADAVDSRKSLRGIATRILPPSSMEELVDHIHQTLTVSTQQSAQISAK